MHSKHLIATKKVFPQGFYIFESRAAANSNYIENMSEAKLLLRYANYFLKDVLIIHDYVITRHGWLFAVKIKAPETQSDLKRYSYWRKVSNRVRLCISTYVRAVNFRRGRSGALVHSNFKKYAFNNLTHALSLLNKIRNQKIKLYQRRKKYRGIKYHYKVRKNRAKGSIFLCSKYLKKEMKTLKDQVGSQVFKPLEDLVGSDFNGLVQKWQSNITSIQTPNDSS